MRNDLKPLPRHRQWWHRTADRRKSAWRTMKTAAAKLLTLAISVLGAILISVGAYQMYVPAGYVTGGLLCWVLVWAHEQDKGGSA